MQNQAVQNQKLIIVPPLISDSSYALFWAEKWTDSDQKRKVYCPLDVDNNPSTALHAYRFFKSTEVQHCQCVDDRQCIEQFYSEFQQQSIVVAGCPHTDNIARKIICRVCQVEPQLHLDPNQILIVRWLTDSYDITPVPLRLTPLYFAGRNLVA